MKPRLLPYFVAQALRNVYHNRAIHAVGLGTVVVSLLIFGTFLLVFFNVSEWMAGWGHSVSFSVYLDNDISREQKDAVSGFIESLPGAEITRFISRDEALRELKNTLGAYEGLLEGLSGNPLPASFEVSMNDPRGTEDVDALKDRIAGLGGVEEVQFSEDWMQRFQGLMEMVRLAGVVIGALLSVGILFLVTNSIKLTIYSRRDEIEILKLVGATDWFVKIPFLLEGMIQGLLGGLIALGILFAGYMVLSTKKMQFLGLAVLEFNFIPHEYAVALCLASVVLGLAGSFIAVGRFFEL